MQKRPALMLPAGEKDWRKRVTFMEVLRPKLLNLGWTVGVELKGKNLDFWAIECCGIVNRLRGRIVWHLPHNAAYGLGQEDNTEVLSGLTTMMSQAENFRKAFGLEAVVLHAAPAIVRTEKPAKTYERYFSPIRPEEYLKQLQRQAVALKAINEQSGGLLCLENVDICSFSEGGCTLPTYLGLQAGSWLDLAWLAKETGCRTVFDSEHFFGSRNFLTRCHEFEKKLSYESNTAQNETEIEFELRTGYIIREGRAPISKPMSLCQYLSGTSPTSHFHIGGAHKAFTSKGELACHLPFGDVQRLSSETIRAIQISIGELSTGNGIGAVIEVCGQNVPGPYSPWSPRIIDDEVAKMQTYLAVINEIEVLQRSQ